MNLRDLQYLVSVAEHRHFGRAAEACHVSQPTLSGQIRKVEDLLGVTVFERTNRAVAVTPVGAQIVEHARRALREAESITALARAQRDPLSGPLRIGMIPTLSPYLMPLILRRMTEVLPNLEPIWSEETTDTLLNRLENHEIDAALLATSVEDDESLESLDLFDEPFWVAFPRGHLFERKESVCSEDLPGAKVLVLADGHCLRDQALEVCGSDRTGLEGDLRATSLETLLNMASAGFGCTLVPALAMRGSWTTDMGLLTRPLTDSAAKRTVRLVCRRSFPRKLVLRRIADIIVGPLPNTVTARHVAAPLDAGGEGA